MKNLYVLLFIFVHFGITNKLFAQIYEISLPHRIAQAEIIIEGEVKSQFCTLGSDNNIYTINNVEISKILKGNFQEKQLQVVTLGGTLNGITENWTHALEISKGEIGVFFLQKHSKPLKEHFLNQTFEVYSGCQGFIKFCRNDNKAFVGMDFFSFYSDIYKQVYQPIINWHLENNYRLSDSYSDINVDRTGIRFHLKDVSFENNKIGFSVFVNSLYGTKTLYASGLQFQYNTSFLGNYIVQNDKIELFNSGISATQAYYLDALDVSSKEAEVRLTPSSNVSNLIEITHEEKLLCKVEIEILNLLQPPNISYDIEKMLGKNLYKTDEGVFPFDTIIVEGEWRETCLPYIDDFNPKSVSGGTGDIITITGLCFGTYAEGITSVEFTDASKGNNPIQWMQPLPGDYTIVGNILSWEPELIRVEVPSVHKIAFDNYTLEKYAGTGRIRVRGLNGTGESTSELMVRFSAKNTFTKSNELPPSEGIPWLCTNANGTGGHSLTLDASLTGIPDAVERFTDALLTWQCATNVNFTINSTNNNQFGDIINISYAPLADGTLGTTKTQSQDCIASSGDKTHSIIRTAQMTFASNPASIQYPSRTWYFGKDENGIMADQVDFQTIFLHEIGHLHLLNHVNQNDNIMWHGVRNGIANRDLKSGDLEGGQHIVSISQNSVSSTSGCSNPMIPYSCSNATSDLGEDNSLIKLNPNPTFESLSASVFDSKIVKYKIFDSFGNLIVAKSFFSEQDYINLDTSSFTNGLYFLQVETVEGKISSAKFIRQ